MVLSVFMLSQQQKQTVKTNGVATYYAEKYHGRKTASGEIYNQNNLTCAADKRNYKFGTKLKITNITNNKSVIVKVTDTGKDIIGNRIDLSKAAFKTIANLNTGVIKILIEEVLDI